MIMTKQIKVLITDDSNQVRRGLAMLLSTVEGFEVVGQAINGRQALELTDSVQPDVVLMDVGMPVMDGIEACQQLKERFAHVKIIMLTSHESDDDVLASLAAGANGYCLKEADLERLIVAIKAVASGDLWLDSQIAEKINMLARLQQPTDGKSPLKIFEALSKRELEILNLVVEGFTNQAIAERLSIGIETVKTHVKHIMDKLAVDDRTKMAVKAIRSGLVQ